MVGNTTLKNKNGQRKRVKGALLTADVLQAEIAQELRIKDQYVCDVIAGRKRSSKVEDLIAKRTGQPVGSLFEYRNTKTSVQMKTNNFETI